ncbi:BCCT family transporter [Shewanella olleyana]|uniref:BCCT family transporter n=1 Tax=Shewanella olleyana TaxID=135626 RepID=UPI00200CD376|nr:BCCT family transporter [Shewanella olleyana]MCL1067810.1 BCCT family transporter [Shewanella olleyana]
MKSPNISQTQQQETSTNQKLMTPKLGFYLPVIIIAGLLLAFPHKTLRVFSAFTQFFLENFDSQFIQLSSLLLLLAIVIAISPIGKMIIGGHEAKTEFSFASWIAMLFTAGMGSGLIFWGVAEPVYHFVNPPAFLQDDFSSVPGALAITYFHWGLHAWAIYAMAGLVMAWFAYNRNRSLRISASFSAEKPKWLSMLDLLAVIAIVFGMAGTFANTVALIQTGVEQSMGLNIGSQLFRIGLIVIIAMLFTLSSIAGLNKGIKRLSQFNSLFMIVMLVAVILLVDPFNSLSLMAQSTLEYIKLLPSVSLGAGEPAKWSQGWSVIYLIWWIAWAPFVGPFIARISKGRSVRQFLSCTILLPTLASILWFSGFAGSVLTQPFANEVMAAVNQEYTLGLFSFFAQLPLGMLFSIAALLLLVTFIITSADSSIYITSMLTGSESQVAKLLWSAVLVAITIALVTINDVDLNKQIAIVGAIPFTLVMCFQIVFWLKDVLITKNH